MERFSRTVRWKIQNKTNDGKVVGIRDTELLKNSLTTEDMNLKIITCFEGVGLITGKKLLDNPDIKAGVNELISLMGKQKGDSKDKK